MKPIPFAVALLVPVLTACANTTPTSSPTPSPTPPPAAQDEWKTFGYALTLAQIFVRTATFIYAIGKRTAPERSTQ